MIADGCDRCEVQVVSEEHCGASAPLFFSIFEVRTGPRDLALHTLMHTLPVETRLQYIGLSSENAEFLAPLFSSQHSVLNFPVGKCGLRDVISSLLPCL